ncbi:MAG: MmcQ/YjbR family DNA-binding protein [Roseitalea porphyridii]|jgi:predicted DNA-binding protein (MmcQ/YjbR family)|uniref:MmcQ/YjbR family DNA-binding protein n=1 Tax=Roseitalea porphyridii TaxID=1852022 RepID=UPI0032D8FED6
MSEAFRARVADICSALPGSEVSDPWGGGHDAYKVAGKMYACIGAITPGVAVKCADIETAEMLKQVGAAAHAPYFHKSWVLVAEDADGDELRHRIETSYDIVRAKLPRKVRDALPARPAMEAG